MTYHTANLSPNQPPLTDHLPSTFNLLAPSGTDIWRKPPSTSTFNAPLVYRSLPLSSFRRARVTISAEWKTLYDQGGLCLALPMPEGQSSENLGERKWIKTGIEFYNGGPQVSTVACDRWADWSLLPLPNVSMGASSVTIGMERDVRDGEKTSTLWVYILEGVEKRAVREITWVFGEEQNMVGDCWVGVYVAKPTKDEGKPERELEVQFGGLVIETF